jgi:hypothetical protein
MKGLENIKKVKSPVKPAKVSPNKRNNKSYENFLRGKDEKKEISKDKKVIKVQRKKSSPKMIKKDIRDINDIERKMIQMKDNNIKVPTQNTTMNKNITPKPIIQNPPKRVEKIVKPESENIYNGPRISNNKLRRVRISDIDVREKRPDETLTEKKQIVQKAPEVKKPEPKKQVDKPKRSLTRSINRSNTRSNNRSKNNRSKNNRSKTNRKISIHNKKLDEKDIQNVSQKIRQIRNTKSDEIKKELEKQGVKVSGKSDRLLKDIYLYSKVCNINITHEK